MDDPKEVKEVRDNALLAKLADPDQMTNDELKRSVESLLSKLPKAPGWLRRHEKMGKLYASAPAKRDKNKPIIDAEIERRKAHNNKGGHKLTINRKKVKRYLKNAGLLHTV